VISLFGGWEYITFKHVCSKLTRLLPWAKTDNHLTAARGYLANVGLPLFKSMNVSRPRSPRLVSDQRDHRAAISFLNNVLAFQSYLSHQNKVLLINSNNLPAHCITQPSSERTFRHSWMVAVKYCAACIVCSGFIMLIYTNQGFSIILPLVEDQTALTVGRS